MKLLELFNRPLEWEIKTNTGSTTVLAFVTSGNNNYEVHIDHSERPNGEIEWSIAFGQLSGGSAVTDITSSGNEFEVFSTVLDILTYYIDEKDPDEIVFSGKGGSRQKLYTALIKKLSSKYRYNLSIHGNTYILEK